MVLIVTNKLDPHADAVIEHLKREGADFVRFNIEDFPQKAVFSWQANSSGIDGVIRLPGGYDVTFSHINSCWYRRPTAPIVSRELITKQAKEFTEDEANSLLNGLWTYLADCFWISYPFKVRQAESKMSNLRLAAEVGFLIPQTLITNNPENVKDFFQECQGKMINKVLDRGQVEYLRDYYFVYTHRVLSEDLEKIDSVRYTPALFQEYVPKNIEIRVTIVGRKVFSCEIHSQDSQKTRDDWRHYDLENVKHVVHQLPESVERPCFKMLDRLDLNFATFDLILTPDNQYVFLELNPNGQWLWIEQLTGMPISRAITELLINRGEKS